MSSYNPTNSPPYYSALRGGITPSPHPVIRSSTASTAAMAGAASSIPPPPLAGHGRVNEEKHDKDDDHDDGHNLAHSGDMTSNANTEASTTISADSSTPHLQSRLISLRQQSQSLSNALTKKLATSRSGQSLLHIGPSLSTLPPDLSSLLEALAPLLGEVENYEKENRAALGAWVNHGWRVRVAMGKGEAARECAEIYEDLVGAEEVLRREVERRVRDQSGCGDGGEEKKRREREDYDLSDDDDEELGESEDVQREML